MITNELRLGNWVTGRNDPPMQVAAISKGTVELYMPGSVADNFVYDEMEIKPILLIGDDLLKFGFRRADERRYFISADALPKKGYGFDLTFILGEWNVYCASYPASIQYIHQLQNLYFFLTGQELTYNSEPPPTGAIATEAK